MSSWNLRRAKATCLWLLVVLTLGAGTALAQEAQNTQPAPAQSFKPEEIEALVAPIALYPDSVLSQVLMASTYPLEIVHAARWVKANPNVKGDAAVKAVENEPWDVSVKSLVAFPQILEPMNDKLDWTQKLGDAFLAQQKEVFAAVQRLRARAKDSGNLKSNEQQNVVVEPAPAGGQTQTIVKIEPANPQVIYVPAYNPTVVYGAWSYPAYPPTYWPPYPAYYPGAALMTGFAWGIGLAAAGAIFSNCNWGGGDVNINVNKAANIDRNFDRTKVEGGRWQHDGSHRQGVAYRDNATRDKYSRNVSGAEGRNDFRGRDGGAGGRANTADRGNAGNRGSVADRSNMGDRGGAGGVGGADRSAAGNFGGGANRAGTSDLSRAADRVGGGGGGVSGGRDNAFQGVGAGGATQRSYDRGRSSMQGSGFSRPSGGGGMRAGGGRGGRR
ncbi:DUF3300 domain-containing protein [Paraburkholderia sp. PGU16]|uniref:DUF3300 domain-containing protein n=1 Tax=Paraburkholderia largidicola TaxID=3014751 RepID=A0A7I8BR11_9BURK|nr:DUF3300 domain-containing protein [Paraburkholderia sp. PGU16]BCF90953.1 hypothetical protein PPGU16_40200 [Paraburkholderia sp. PGU16]BEU24751.1 DUF3300 domain-containing protein [Paraburkholderia sp. 22B1P]